MAHNLPGASDDGDHDALAALDFSAASEGAGETDLPEIPGAMHMFTVTNPPGTVTVTTWMDGRVHQIELEPKVTTLGERALAEEIVAIADLATQDARAAQYTLMLDGMREQGHDNVATRDFLNRDLALPTPEQAQAARAKLFTERYAGEE